MDDTDDFGDLYENLDYHMSYEKEGDKLESTPTEVDLVKESESNGKVTTSEAKRTTNLEDDNSNNSESDDDDFRIVLNEEECPKFQPSKGGIAGIDEEDEFDSVADHLNNDQRWNDQLAAMAVDESTQGSEVSGVGLNGSQRPSRHVGSHLAGFPTSMRSSAPGRGAWDKPLMPCFQNAASYNRDSSTTAQTGATFRLPRHRTIFDINIEVFEHKPWRHHGADITDYFNFGLDEESWKSYCQALDQCRKQTRMSNRFPAYQSSWLNQPKGRAIQVEGGLGERIPSTDVRRPRVLDSDVVIQINMEGSAEDASALCKDSLEQAEEDIDASLSTSGNNSNERESSRQHDGYICRHTIHSVDHYSPKLDGSNFRVTYGEVKSNVDRNKDDEKDLFITDACMVNVGSDSGGQVPNHPSSCNLGSHSEESKDTFSMGKGARPIKKPSVEGLQDSIESDRYLSYDSLSDATDCDVQEDSKNDSHEHNKHFSLTTLKSVAELNVAKHEELRSSVVHRKHQKDLDLWDIKCKTRKRKSCYDTDNARKHLYSYRETEVSPSYRSRTQAAKHDSEKSFTRDSRKGYFVTHRNGNWIEEDCLAQRQMYISERSCEDRGRRSSVCKQSNQSVSKNKSFFKEKDSYLHLAKEREGDLCIRMDPEDYGYREQHGEDMHGRRTDFYDMEENFDTKFGRHVHSIERKLRSPERGRYDKRSRFHNKSSEYIENGVHHRLVSHRYEESSNTDARYGYDACSPGEYLPILWRSNGRYRNHRDHPNIRELQFKNKKYGHVIPSIKDHHHLSHEDSLGSENDGCSENDGYISEGNVYCENIVSSIHMRRCNRLAKLNLHADNGARFRHRGQGGLPSPERFLFERSSKHDKLKVSKPFFHGQRLFGGRLLNNARKIGVWEMSDLDARDHVNFVQDMANHELAAVGCRESVNKHLNGFKSKLAKRSIGVAGESEEDIGTAYKGSLLKNSRHLKQAGKQGEAYSYMSKGENSHNHQTGLKVDKVKDSCFFNSDDHTKISLGKFPASHNLEDAEIEEGELIEEPDKKDVSVTKCRTSGKKVDNILSKDSTHDGKISGTYDNNRILETLAKMEKRRERFKEPIAPKQGPEKTMDPQVDVSIVSDEAKQQRPTRKRRWGGN